MAESLPTSVSAFAHRRARADSIASFTYYPDDLEPSPIHQDDDGSAVEDLDDLPFVDEEDDEEDSADQERRSSENDYVLHRRASTQSRGSVRSRLLRRDSSSMTAASVSGGGRFSQKIYMVNEDLTVVVAGFQTSRAGFAAYLFICVATLGLGWLLFRWLPRWHVRLVGEPCALRDSTWTVIENQWGEMAILKVQSRPYGRPLSTVFGSPGKLSSFMADEEHDPILTHLRTLNYRYVRFYFHPPRDKFLLCNGWKDPTWTDVRGLRAGINSEEKSHRDVVFGSNLIDIEEKSVFSLLVDEVFHPFYVFQIASLVLWSMDEYYYYAFAIFVMSLVAIVQQLVDTKANMKRMREISRFECEVRVLRNGFWRHVSSNDLVPGDVYEVSDPNLEQFPSDSLLLSGDCIINESMLTGESVPVSKVPATDEALHDLDLAAPAILPEIARHFLFCGTKIIRARKPQEDREGEAVALAVVVRTGFNTTKGALVRTMLFPKPSGFKFYRDAFRYISVMACVALLGFVVSFVNFVRLQLAWHLIIVRALDLITIVVPPALPATLSIGTSFALARLKKKKIFCISPQRINVGGKLDIMCFDKTGTLTEDGLDVLGVRVVSRTARKFGEMINDAASLVPARAHGDQAGPADDTQRAALYTMATCHSLRSVDGELIGDPLELKMFEFTGWSFEESGQSGRDATDEEQSSLSPSIVRPPAEMVYDLDLRSANNAHPSFELGVIKSFDFVSQLRRASVVVRLFGEQGGDVYVKGAPECMREICNPESFPSDYDALLSHYTHKGYRVIGCATKHVKRLSWVKAQNLSRHEVESGLEFVGFIIFENKLKPTTTPVIDELMKSNIGTVMVTGDNILTAISVARECGMIDSTAHCFLPRFVEGPVPTSSFVLPEASDTKAGHSRDPNSKLQWESIDNSVFQLDENTLMVSREEVLLREDELNRS